MTDKTPNPKYAVFNSHNQIQKILPQLRETKTLIILADNSRWYKDNLEPYGTKRPGRDNMGPKRRITLAEHPKHWDMIRRVNNVYRLGQVNWSSFENEFLQTIMDQIDQERAK